jgi:hypothetical protein
MNKLLLLLFPQRAKREQMLRIYDELEVGILLCRTMDDTCNMSWKVYKEMEPMKELRYFKQCYDKLWKLLEMQREHIMSKPQTVQRR